MKIYNSLLILVFVLKSSIGFAAPDFTTLDNCLLAFGLGQNGNDGNFSALPLRNPTLNTASLLLVNRAGANVVEMTKQVEWEDFTASYVPPGQTEQIESGYTNEAGGWLRWSSSLHMRNGKTPLSPTREITLAEAISLSGPRLLAAARQADANIDKALEYLDLSVRRLSRDFTELPDGFFNDYEIKRQSGYIERIRANLDACERLNDDAINSAISLARARYSKLQEKLDGYQAQEAELRACVERKLSAEKTKNAIPVSDPIQDAI